MRPLAIVILLASPGSLRAGMLGSPVPWISEATALEELVVNNDDYVGEADGNPNRFYVNWWDSFATEYLQDIRSVERLIPTAPSGGTTEYVLFLLSGIDAVESELDSVFELQVGFGTGDNFVPASEVAPDLKFDTPGNVSPPIQDVYFVGSLPMLELIDHDGDTLTFQGRSHVGDGIIIGNYWWSEHRFPLPLDVPDLDPSLRELFSPEDLALIPSDVDVPITIRMRAVPEPSARFLAALALLGLFVCHFRPIRARTLRDLEPL